MHYYTGTKLQSEIQLRPSQKHGGLSPVQQIPVRDLTWSVLPKKYRVFPKRPAPPFTTTPIIPGTVTLLPHPHQNGHLKGPVSTRVPTDSMVSINIRTTRLSKLYNAGNTQTEKETWKRPRLRIEIISDQEEGSSSEELQPMGSLQQIVGSSTRAPTLFALGQPCSGSPQVRLLLPSHFWWSSPAV